MSQDLQLIRDRLRSVVIIRTADGTGSGFYANADGIIVTNKHVIGPFLSVKVQRFDRSQFEARVVRVARTFDLALLWDTSANLPPPIPLSDPAATMPGEPVQAIGHPRGLDYTITRGIVSATNRMVNGIYYVQTDTVTHPGSSGGPLLSADGSVVGVSTFGLLEDGLNFALSVRYVHELLGEMMVKPVAPGFRRCGVCSAKNSMVRRSCRRCGADFASQARDERAASFPKASDTVSAPSYAQQLNTSTNEVALPAPDVEPVPSDPLFSLLVTAIKRLEPPATQSSIFGNTIDLQWRDCTISVTLFRGTEPHISANALALEVPVDDAPFLMRLALEMNLASSIEAKIGMRGSQMYVAAARGLPGLDEVEIVALLSQIVEVRSRFIEAAQAQPDVAPALGTGTSRPDEAQDT